jgi:hypothetical protein
MLRQQLLHKRENQVEKNPQQHQATSMKFFHYIKNLLQKISNLIKSSSITTSWKLSTLTTKIEKIAIQTTFQAFTSIKAETVPEIATSADALVATSQQPIPTQAPTSSSVFQEPVTNVSAISTENSTVATNISSFFATNTTGNTNISTTSNFTTAIYTSTTNTSTSTSTAIPTTTTTAATPATTSDPAVFLPHLNHLKLKYFLQLLFILQEIFRCNSLTLPKNVRKTQLYYYSHCHH